MNAPQHEKLEQHELEAWLAEKMSQSTYPLHLEQSTLRNSESFFEVPLYNSSRETFRG